MELKKRGKLHYGEHNKKESMKKRKVIILSMAIIIIALLLEVNILKYVNDKNAYRTSQVLLDRVVTVLDKNDKSKAQKHRILLAQELLDVIQICITGLIMLTKDGIDIKLQLWNHNYKLIKERKWKANKYIEMRVRENVDKND